MMQVSDIVAAVEDGTTVTEADLLCLVTEADAEWCNHVLSGSTLREFLSPVLSGVMPAGLPAAQRARLVALARLAHSWATTPLQKGEPLKKAEDVFLAYGSASRDLKVEQFRAILLDGKHRVMREIIISQGTLTSSPVHPREVFTAAVRFSAAAIIIIHNHPSGDPTPSADDLEITRRLKEVGDLIGIRVLDHVILGDGCFRSLADSGLL